MQIADGGYYGDEIVGGYGVGGGDMELQRWGCWQRWWCGGGDGDADWLGDGGDRMPKPMFLFPYIQD